jgi:DNA polymerase-3 subunit beta
MLTSVATDGHRLLMYSTNIAGADRLPRNGTDRRGIILPELAIAEIERIAAKSDVTLSTDGKLLGIRAGAVSFVTKMVDSTFPDYPRVLVPPSTTTAVLDVADMVAALRRLVATAETAEKEAPLVCVSWDDGGDGVHVEDRHGAADDLVIADVHGTCRVAIPVPELLDLLQALPAAQVTISAQSGTPNAPLRFDVVGTAIVGLQTPSTRLWRRAAA